jgi:CBS domain-containing protein
MAATFGAAIRATFTAIVFCFELTRDYEAILPLMLAGVLAQLVAGALLSESLMTQKLARRGLHVASDYEADVLGHTEVRDVMTTDVDALPASATVADVRRHFEHGAHGAYPIVDDDGRCVAIVARHDLLQADAAGDDPATSIGSRPVVTVAPATSLRNALTVLLEEDIGHLPVVADGRLVGMCTRTDILHARRHQIDAEHAQPGWHPTLHPHRLHVVHAPAVDGHRGAGTGRRCAYLVVANQTLGSPQLHDALAARVASGPCRLHLLVPATRPHDLYQTVLDAYCGELPDDDLARTLAHERLDVALDSLDDLGVPIDGEVGDPDPLAAIRLAVAREDYDEIVISTLPAHLSRWLHLDLPHRVEHTFHIPVTHVEPSMTAAGEE